MFLLFVQVIAWMVIPMLGSRLARMNARPGATGFLLALPIVWIVGLPILATTAKPSQWTEWREVKSLNAVTPRPQSRKSGEATKPTSVKSQEVIQIVKAWPLLKAQRKEGMSWTLGGYLRTGIKAWCRNDRACAGGLRITWSARESRLGHWQVIAESRTVGSYGWQFEWLFVEAGPSLLPFDENTGIVRLGR